MMRHHPPNPAKIPPQNRFPEDPAPRSASSKLLSDNPHKTNRNPRPDSAERFQRLPDLSQQPLTYLTPISEHENREMSNKFCTQTAKKIRALGVAPKAATFYSRFFYLSMLSVSGIIITGQRNRKGAKVLGEETPRSLRHTLAGLIALPGRNTGAGYIIAGPAAEVTVPASSHIRSN